MTPELPTRVVFFGGPFDAYVWFPHRGLVSTQYADEHSLTEHNVIDSGAPTVGHLAADGVICVHDAEGVGYGYEWVGHDDWMYLVEEPFMV